MGRHKEQSKNLLEKEFWYFCGKSTERNIPHTSIGYLCYNVFMAYSDNSRGNDRRSFNRPSYGRDENRRSFDKPQLHPATCSKCGKSCMVPFIATGNRPIFCNDCFKTEGGRDTQRSDDRRSGGFRDNDRRMFDAICDQCGNRCQVPFQPRDGKEVLCSHCFEQKGKEERGIFPKARNDDELKAVNAKLDKILSLLESLEIVALDTQTPEPTVAATTSETVEEVAETKKAPAKKKAAPKKKTAPKAK